MASFFGGGETYFHVENDAGTRNYFKEKGVTVTPEFFNVFTFDWVEGSTDVHILPEHVFIPLSIKRKLFGNEPAVGRQMVLEDGENRTVLAVYRDFSANTILENRMYFVMPPDQNRDNWGEWGYNSFIRVNDASNAPQLVENFLRNFDYTAAFGGGASREELEKIGFQVYLTALKDIHFLPDMQYDYASKASRQTLMVLFAIAIVIIAIAAINFTNFSTALTPMRIKSINTQRVLGARRSTIRRAIASEAVIIGLLSYLIALGLVAIFNISPLARLVAADLSLSANLLIVGGSALVALITGFLAGTYPARYMTSFAPALVLKGSFALSPKGRKLRNALIGIQFVASFALIVGASFMYLQNYFMQNASLGYNRDRLVIVDIGRIQKSRDAFTNQIKAYSGIEDVTYSTFLLSGGDGYSKWGIPYRGEDITFQAIPVHHAFLDVMGIEVTDGRSFRQEDTNKENGVYIFNESARKQFNMELNSSIEGWRPGEIIGFMPDIKFASFRMAVEPMAFYLAGSALSEDNYGGLGNAYIRLKAGAGLSAAVSHIHTTLAGYESNYPFDVLFFDEVLQRLYQKETALSSLITLFSLIAIFIAIVGVFGLVVFDSECRRKEIGIRKVLGASTIGIIIMFNKAYFKILTVCFVVAAPLAWYAVSRWLENFAYKTPMYWWVYLLAFVAIAVITVCTVTFQNWRVASDNPLKAIKSE
jgi:putative ABC transport system permease protein